MTDEEIDWTKLKSFKDLKTLSSPSPKSPRGRRNPFPRPGLNQIPLYRSKSKSTITNPYCFKPLLKTTQCKRTTSINLRGKKIDFQYFNSEIPLYHAKIKPGQKPEFIRIAEGDTSHISGNNYQYTMLIGNDYCDFSLREGDLSGEELMTVQIRIVELDCPRIMKVFFYNQSERIPPVLVTRQPILHHGSWIVSLGGGNVIASIKNVVLEDRNNRPLIVVRKIAEDTLEMESYADIPDVLIFGVAVSSFLCKA